MPVLVFATALYRVNKQNLPFLGKSFFSETILDFWSLWREIVSTW